MLCPGLIFPLPSCAAVPAGCDAGFDDVLFLSVALCSLEGLSIGFSSAGSTADGLAIADARLAAEMTVELETLRDLSFFSIGLGFLAGDVGVDGRCEEDLRMLEPPKRLNTELDFESLTESSL